MAALLTSVLNNSDKVAEYITECRECSIPVLPPDINHSYDGFTVEGENIRFGLVAIKNIGRGFIQTLIKRRDKDGPFTSFQDFCQRMNDAADMNKRAVENLIRSGAFDSLGAKRSQLIRVFESVMDSVALSYRQNLEGQIDMFSMGPAVSGKLQHIHLPDIPEFSAMELMTMEKETTGLFLSGHPMRDYRELAKASGAVPIQKILADFEQEQGPTRLADGQSICIAGVVTSSKTRPTKNNSIMAYVTVEDETGSIELLCFQRSIDQFGSYMQVNLPVIVTGRLSVRDEKPPQLVVNRVLPIADMQDADVAQAARQAAAQAHTVYLRIEDSAQSSARKVFPVLKMFPGKAKAVVYYADSGARMGGKCAIDERMLREMRELLGEKNVIVK